MMFHGLGFITQSQITPSLSMESSAQVSFFLYKEPHLLKHGHPLPKPRPCSLDMQLVTTRNLRHLWPECESIQSGCRSFSSLSPETQGDDSDDIQPEHEQMLVGFHLPVDSLSIVPHITRV